MYVPISVLPSGHQNESLAIVGVMMNERSGLWLITEDRVSLFESSFHGFSARCKPVVEEMLAIASRGDKFWPIKAEYYAALSEVRVISGRVTKGQIEDTIQALTRGARISNVLDSDWVRKTLGILKKVSNER